MPKDWLWGSKRARSASRRKHTSRNEGNRTTEESGVALLVPPIGEEGRVRGPANASATLVEYGDYDCPYTVRAYSIVRGLRKRMGDRMRFAFRAFLLPRIHAQAAAEAAAEAAATQDRFSYGLQTLLASMEAHTR